MPGVRSPSLYTPIKKRLTHVHAITNIVEYDLRNYSFRPEIFSVQET